MGKDENNESGSNSDENPKRVLQCFVSSVSHLVLDLALPMSLNNFLESNLPTIHLYELYSLYYLRSQLYSEIFKVSDFFKNIGVILREAANQRKRQE